MALSHGSHGSQHALRDWDWRATVRDLVDQVPGSDDIRRLANPSSWHARSGPSGFALVGLFAAGLLAGAGLALLFAPKPGQELRHQLRRQAGLGGREEESSRRYGDGPSAGPSAIPQR
jgi:hypothetical protein